jgi:L-seryl-tRNA(Ser) seleniumtransferase
MRAGSRGPVRDPDLERRLRGLPSVEQLLRSEPLRSAAADAPRALAVAAARDAVEHARSEIRQGNGTLPSDALALEAADRLERWLRPSLRPVINATGVVVHTNLGRAPLSEDALRAIERAAGYSNLELDLERGTRGSRHAHVEALIVELTGAEAGFAVNNNAAAVLLALAALAREREVVISRGQLVEIGGSFRIPDILGASGARLVEIGTTNRTHRADYESAIGPQTAALMRVHSSNCRTVGFTQ